MTFSSTFQRIPVTLDLFPQDVQMSLGPSAAPPMRMMAAMGVLPSPTEVTVVALYFLAIEDSPKLGSRAVETVANMPPSLVVPAVSKLNNASVLDWIAEIHSNDDQILTAISRNKHTDVATICAIASACSTPVSDAIAINQVRLLQNPEIIAALAANDNTQLATLETVVELATREGVTLDQAVLQALQTKRFVQDPNAQQVTEDPLATFVEERGIDHDTFANALEFEDQMVEKDRADQEAYDQMSRVEKEEMTQPLEEEEQRELPAFALILNMSIAQKMQYLTRCGSDALNILVHDPNRLIHEAAVRSPRARPIDVARWSKDKGLPDSVLSYIASRRDWIRSYEILHNLVCNPRTPLADAMNLINHVRTNDLRNLARNRNVSSNISRQAGMLFKKRSGGK